MSIFTPMKITTFNDRQTYCQSHLPPDLVLPATNAYSAQCYHIDTQHHYDFIVQSDIQVFRHFFDQTLR